MTEYNTSIYIHPTSIVDDGATIGRETKVWHFCHISSEAIIGNNCTIGQNVFVGNGSVIGNNVKIQNNVSLFDGVILEDDVFCGPSMVFTNVLNPRAAIDRKLEFKKTIIRQGTTIGANATIICGVEIGKYAFIGAGSVITKNVAPHALVFGVPGKQCGWVSHNGEILKSDLFCSSSNKQYKLVNNRLFLT